MARILCIAGAGIIKTPGSDTRFRLTFVGEECMFKKGGGQGGRKGFEGFLGGNKGDARDQGKGRTSRSTPESSAKSGGDKGKDKGGPGSGFTRAGERFGRWSKKRHLDHSRGLFARRPAKMMHSRTNGPGLQIEG
jgi:hypothetical protein